MLEEFSQQLHRQAALGICAPRSTKNLQDVPLLLTEAAL